MQNERKWTLVIAALHKDGTMFLFEPVSGAHVEVKELFDSGLALLKFTVVVPRGQAEELQGLLALDESGKRFCLDPRAAAVN